MHDDGMCNLSAMQFPFRIDHTLISECSQYIRSRSMLLLLIVIFENLQDKKLNRCENEYVWKKLGCQRRLSLHSLA